MPPGNPIPLSEREKEVLRLLLIGHDAKSIAPTLGLSVHTVNDQLREARRKLPDANPTSLNAMSRLTRIIALPQTL